MRYGFTTGSCAAAASKAAAYMLLTGKEKTEITIETPKGILYTAKILEVDRKETEVCCAVEKDGGEDPDITTGILIYARVSYGTEGTDKKTEAQVLIDGGVGVGRVTKPGLDQPIGNAAINHVPREMITKEVLEVCQFLDYQGVLEIEIFVPEGERLAREILNPKLGIVNGISILGTSGIVEPMSSQALLKTIQVQLNQRKAQGYNYVVISPGNYGQNFIKRTYGYDLDRSIKCSNFIGDTMDMAAELGFQRVLLIGHIGKLIKVAGGIMNTHSKEGDCRMELITAFAVKFGAGTDCACRIMEAVTTEEAVRILRESGKQERVMDYVIERICYYLNRRTKGKLQADCIVYTNEFGELAKSREAEKWFTLLEQEQEQ